MRRAKAVWWRWVYVRKICQYLITDQYVDPSRTLFKDLIYLSGRDVEQLSDLLRQLSRCELLQVDGVIHCEEKNGRFPSLPVLYRKKSH